MESLLGMFTTESLNIYRFSGLREEGKQQTKINKLIPVTDKSKLFKIKKK